MLRVYLDKLMYSPFDFPEFIAAFKKAGILIVKNPGDAHIILSSYLNVLEKQSFKSGSNKKYILWTHEPYHDFTYTSTSRAGPNKIHIMNCYTGDVFTHNFRYFYFRNKIELIQTDKTDNQAKITGNSIVALSTYYDTKYYSGNKYTTLPIRYKVIEEGVKRNLVDVHGKGWEKHPFVKTVANTRNDKDRRESKGNVLEDYKFNICLENANFPNYVTEKIWESIKYGCLPIYYSNDTIYEVFPPNSFIDVREYEKKANNLDLTAEDRLDEGIKQMYEDILNMTSEEYVRRYNECAAAFNKVIEENKNNTTRLKSDNLNINYLEYKTCYTELLKKLKSIV